MKKTIIFCLTAALLSVGLIGGAAAALDSKKEAVELHEEILCGDPSAADGLALDIRFDLPSEGKYNQTGNVWWELNQKYNDGLQFTPEFHFVHEPPNKTYYWEHQGLRLETLGDYEGRYNDQYWITDAFFESIGTSIPVHTTEGNSGTVSVDLSEHFDYLPLWFNFDFPHGVTDLTVNDQVVGSGYELYQTLNELFPIPVPENTYVTIGFSLDEDGDLKFANTQEFGYDEDGNPVDVLLLSASVCTEDGIYFTLSPTAYTGKRLDLSALKLGYGIYYLPVVPYYSEDPSNELRQPDVEGLRRVIELDPNAIDEIIELHWSEADDRLYVLTCTGGRYSLLCYEASTLTLTDTLALGAAFQGIRYEDGFLLVYYTDNTFSVLTERTDGYDELFRHRSHFCESGYLLGYPETYVAFDGTRLAIASPDYETGGIDHTLAVYTAEGLQFHANYVTNLHNACYSNWYHMENAPMTLHWGAGEKPQPTAPYSISPTTTIH